MEKQEIEVKVNEALAQEFEIEVSTISPNGDIKETLDLDSLSLVDMVALLESLFGVEIKLQDISSIKTFNNLYDFIDDRL